MWEQEEFAKHWRNEFPDGEVPEMDLNSVEDIETELEKCKSNLKKLQKALSEEKFKVIYLQTTVARQKRSYDQERFDGKDENFNADTVGFSKMGNIRKTLRGGDEGDRETTRVSGGGKLQPPGNPGGVTGSVARDQSRFSGRTGKPVPPRKPGSQMVGTTPTVVSQPDDNGETSDHDYDDVELNENFVRSNLVAPKTIRSESQRSTAPHRDVLRPFRQSRDLDSGDDGRLSPSFMQVHRRASRGSGCSTPDRRSDGYLSSDHEDSSSA
ncbi:uncharacterized protein, partial [Centroberyx affinis]|uniref:uncharacterized protein n=1 Tax=Centroberyx affinis TaxID=166261 RepID=UPI003A5C117D